MIRLAGSTLHGKEIEAITAIGRSLSQALKGSGNMLWLQKRKLSILAPSVASRRNDKDDEVET